MQEEEIKDRLACYRPGKDDPNDPEFAGALAALDTSPTLQDWYDDNVAFDAAIRSKLAESAIPAGLLVDLKQREGEPAFDEAGADVGPNDSEPNNVIRFPMWSRFAAAAAILMVSLFAVNLFKGQANAEVERFRTAMAEQANQGIVVDHPSHDVNELHRWIDEKKAPVFSSCPDCLQASQGVGCKIITWDNESVSVVCFKKDTNEVVHLFIAKRELLKADKGLSIPVKERGGLRTGGWVDADNVYILVGGAKGVTIEDLL